MTSPGELRGLYDSALAAWQRREIITARRNLEAMAVEELSQTLLGQWRLTYGVVLRELGDVNLAIEQIESFLSGMADYPDLRETALGYGYYNLGLAYRHAAYRSGRDPDSELLDKALTAYDQAAEEFRREHMPGMLMAALHNKAWVGCCSGRAEIAAEALDEAEPLCRSEADWWHQRLGRAFVDAILGSIPSALTVCERISSEPEAPVEVRSHACWIAGQIAYSQEHLDEAESLARSALELGSRVVGESRCYHDAAALLREVNLRRKILLGS